MAIATIENTLGALQIGTVVAIYLFGIVTCQFVDYHQTFAHDDRQLFRISAPIVWLLELGHTICICGELYRGTIIFHGDMTNYKFHPFMGMGTVLGGLITMMVQAFFSLRVWKALPSPIKYIGIVCGGTTVLRAVGGIYLGVRFMLSETLAEYQQANEELIAALLASGAAIDIIIAVSMLYFLISRRDKGMGSTTTMIDRLVAYTIRTGLLTSVTAVAVLILVSVSPHTYIWGAFYVVLAKLYSNSFFSALNERQRLRNVLAESSSSEAITETRRRARHNITDFQGFNQGAVRPGISIEMKTTVLRGDEEKALSSFPPRPRSEHSFQAGSTAI